MTTYFNYLPEELQKELSETAKALVAPGKGVRIIVLFKGSVQRKLRPRLLIAIGALFERVRVSENKISTFLMGHFTIYIKTLQCT